MKRCICVCGLLCLLLSACAPRSGDVAHTRAVFAMDTVMTLAAYGGEDTALEAAEAELRRLDALLARGVEGSAVYVFNHSGTAEDAELLALLTEAEELAAVTDGAFDPYLGGVLDLWGFGSGAGAHRVPSAEEIAAVPRLLDLGGIAKGYAGQRARETLAANGVESAVLDLGGDVALLGNKPDGTYWRVAVKDPANGEAYLGVLETTGDIYVATSGVYERYFEDNGIRYHHILDPRTGYPADSGLVSATVVCGNGVWADALATAVCVLGAETALELRGKSPYPFELILITGDGQVLYTASDFTPTGGNGYFYQLVG